MCSVLQQAYMQAPLTHISTGLHAELTLWSRLRPLKFESMCNSRGGVLVFFVKMFKCGQILNHWIIKNCQMASRNTAWFLFQKSFLLPGHTLKGIPFRQLQQLPLHKHTHFKCESIIQVHCVVPALGFGIGVCVERESVCPGYKWTESYARFKPQPMACILT